MDMNEYQEAARRTDRGNEGFSEEDLILCWALGLAGESGEYADMVKKEHFHSVEAKRAKVADELGDILWYLAIACLYEGFTLEYIAKRNLDKLQLRYPNGFEEGGGNRE